MKLNTKSLLALFVLFIVAFSITCVSAENVDENDVNPVTITGAEIAGVNPEPIATPNTIAIPNNANQSVIQEKIDSANSGDIISFAENGNYTLGLGNDPIEIIKQLTIVGNNATITAQNGFKVISSSTTDIDGTSFTNLTFVNNNTTWNGRAIEVTGGANINITYCKFIADTGNAGVYLGGSKKAGAEPMSGGVTVSNCYFTGSTNSTTITTAGKGETGYKCINIMGGDGVVIKDNVMEGPVLDGISIASNSKNIYVINNTVNGAFYGIYYGGGLVNITTENNTFTDIKAYGIGMVKSASSSLVKNNTIIMGELPDNGSYDSNAAIYLEQGNTAHGGATNIGDIKIIDNTFEITDSVPENQTTYAVELYSAGGQLKLNGYLKINNNTYNDSMIKFAFIDANWNYTDDGSVDLEQYNINTTITPESNEINLLPETSTAIQLTGADGTILPGQTITLTILKNGTAIETRTLTTDKFGIVNLVNNLTKGNYTVNAKFKENIYNGGIYHESTATFKVNSIESTEKINTVLEGNDLVKYYKNATQLVLTLTANGAPLTNQIILVVINGVPYKRTTNEKGQMTLNINLNPGNYTLYALYLGNDNYTSCSKEIHVTVLSTIIASSISMKNSARVPFVAKILNGDGTPADGTKAAANINGVIYYFTVEDGKISLPINLLPNKYIITVYTNVVGNKTVGLKSWSLAQSYEITVTND